MRYMKHYLLSRYNSCRRQIAIYNVYINHNMHVDICVQNDHRKIWNRNNLLHVAISPKTLFSMADWFFKKLEFVGRVSFPCLIVVGSIGEPLKLNRLGLEPIFATEGAAFIVLSRLWASACSLSQGWRGDKGYDITQG